MFAAIDSQWGGLDILVNNAGIDGNSMPARRPTWPTGGASRDQSLRRILLRREALRRMLPQKRGVILNMSSVHEVIPWSGYSAYAASKAASRC